jgi:hypothetical protein
MLRLHFYNWKWKVLKAASGIEEEHSETCEDDGTWEFTFIEESLCKKDRRDEVSLVQKLLRSLHDIHHLKSKVEIMQKQ